MINCPLCHTNNTSLDVICPSCGSYLQTKVDNINLFETLWGLIENPSKTFKNIAISKTKNYIIFLSSLLGISITFLLFRIDKIADTIESVRSIFIIGFLGGIPLGIFLILIISAITLLVARIFKQKTSLKRISAVIVYSATPFVYDLIFLLPLKLLTFGVSYFKSNSSLTLINPTVYYIVLSIEGLLFVWFLYLFVSAIKVVFSTGYLRASVLSLLSLISISGIVYLIKIIWIS